MSDDLRFISTNPSKAIFVERVDEHPVPKYRPFGKSRCVQCNAWVWLGSGPFKVVTSGEATPYCIQCGADVLAAGAVPIAVHESE